MEFQYTLTQEEYLDYCKLQDAQDPTFRRLRRRCWPILPVVCVLLIIAFFPVPWYAWLIAALVSLAWVWLVNYLVARTIIKHAKHRCSQVGPEAYKPLRLQIEDGRIRVNGSKQVLKSYHIFSDLILLQMENDATVILPARAFGGETPDKLRPVLDGLDGCINK